MKPEVIILVPGLGQDSNKNPLLRPFLGTSLLERHIRFTRKFGASGVSIVTDSGEDAAVLNGFLSERNINGVGCLARGDPGEKRSSARPASTLLLWADYLVEEPVLRTIAESPSSCAPVEQDAGNNSELAGAAWISGADHNRLLEELISGTNIPDGITLLERCTFPKFNPGLRRHRRSGWIKITSESDLTMAKTMLIDGAQKGSLDIPAKYLHAAVENAIVSKVAATSITPNQITVVTTIAAWAVTWLILIDQVWTGLAGAAVVGVLDGVDGKLARLKLMTSRLGEMEHLLDMMFEYSWWLALGWTLSGGDTNSVLLWMSIGLILCNFGDTLAGVLFWVFRGRAVGRTIDNYSLFDLRFRLVAGRRNIYIWMLLLLGPLTGLTNAFVACFAWAVVTVLIRMSRALIHIVRPRDGELENFVVV